MSSPTDELARLQAHGTAGEALALYDSLPPAHVGAILGDWAGEGLHTGHPMDGLLELYGWHGNRFDSPDEAHPLVFNGPRGTFSVSVGTAFEHAKWFSGRETPRRHTSTCPHGDCCRRPPESLTARWAGASFPNARLHTSLHAAMPTGAFPGVDEVEVYEFLERHAPATPPVPSS